MSRGGCDHGGSHGWFELLGMWRRTIGSGGTEHCDVLLLRIDPGHRRRPGSCHHCLQEQGPTGWRDGLYAALVEEGSEGQGPQEDGQGKRALSDLPSVLEDHDPRGGLGMWL